MNSDIVLATPITRAVRAEIAYRGGVVSWATMLLPALRTEQLPIVAAPVRSMLEVQASSAIGRPLGACKILERCGRVYTVAFAPHKVLTADPVLPLVLMGMGSRYEKALCTFARHILSFWDRSGAEYQEKWWAKAVKRCNACLNALSEVAEILTTEELAYLVVQLQTPLAWPRGREERDEIRQFRHRSGNPSA